MNTNRFVFALCLALLVSGCAGTGGSSDSDMVEVVVPESNLESASSSDTGQAADGEAVQASDPGDSEKLVCKRMAKLGTRVKSTVCATEAEWKSVEKRGRDSTEKLQRRPQQGKEEG